MRKITGSGLTILLLLFICASPSFAAKKFVQKQTTMRYTSTTGIPAVVSYQSDHLGLNLSFRNFTGLDSVSYSFTYNTNGIAQGVGGTVTAANNPTATRELLFGTCSRGACRYHYNLSNARLVLTGRYTNGKTLTKAYKIKTYQ